jgi:DNA-binding NarL/FixJ family response regulator
VDNRAAISCVVADDHPAVLSVISRLLADEGIVIVAEATDGFDALAAIREHRPDVALIDLALPGMGGMDVVRHARRLAPATATVAYTGLAERRVLVEAIDAGVCGFVTKAAPLADVVRAVRLAARGERYVDAVLGASLVNDRESRDYAELTVRERDVLRLVAAGKRDHEVAGTLFIGRETVRTHLKGAMRKLDAATRTQAVATAIRQELIS